MLQRNEEVKLEFVHLPIIVSLILFDRSFVLSSVARNKSCFAISGVFILISWPVN